MDSQSEWRDDCTKPKALRLVESGPNGLQPGVLIGNTVQPKPIFRIG